MVILSKRAADVAEVIIDRQPSLPNLQRRTLAGNRAGAAHEFYFSSIFVTTSHSLSKMEGIWWGP